MRYEGTIQVMGFLRVIVDEPGITMSKAKSLVKDNPTKYAVDEAESIVFSEWESFKKVEND